MDNTSAQTIINKPIISFMQKKEFFMGQFKYKESSETFLKDV